MATDFEREALEHLQAIRASLDRTSESLNHIEEIIDRMSQDLREMEGIIRSGTASPLNNEDDLMA